MQVHHRTLLRALVLPHRRNANQQAIEIIEAASRGLPPNDPQLQSALRRFASLLKSHAGPAEVSAPENRAEPSVTSEHVDDKAAAEKDETPAPSAAPGENEFDSPWVK
jgi:hypothetical protein